MLRGQACCCLQQRHVEVQATLNPGEACMAQLFQADGLIRIVSSTGVQALWPPAVLQAVRVRGPRLWACRFWQRQHVLQLLFNHQLSCKQCVCEDQGCEPAGSGSDNMYCSSVGNMAELCQSVGKAGCGAADDTAADDSCASEWTVLDEADEADAHKPGHSTKAEVAEQEDSAALGHAATIIQAAYRY